MAFALVETALYRPYNADGRLLYVGIAVDVEARMKGHERDHWFKDIAAVDIELYPDRRQAKAAETEAIRSEWPLWNIHQSPWGCLAADRVQQLSGYWRQDEWGCWHRVTRASSPPRDFDANPWTDSEERSFLEECQHAFKVRRLTAAALRHAEYARLVGGTVS